MQDLDPHVLHTFAPLFFRAHPLRVILPKRPRFLRKDQGCSAKKQTPHRSRLRIKFNCCKCSLLKGTFWGLFSLYKNCFFDVIKIHFPHIFGANLSREKIEINFPSKSRIAVNCCTKLLYTFFFLCFFFFLRFRDR